MQRIYLAVFALILAVTIAVWLSFGTQGARQRDVTPDPEPTAPATASAAPPASTAPRALRQTVENTIVESGVAIHIVRRARIDPPTGPLVFEFTKLEQEAKSGNAVSQYKLGLLLYECRDVPSDPAGLSREVETIHQTRRHGGWDVDAPAEEERTLRNRYENCDHIPAGERDRFRDYLKSAADAGVLEAQVNLPLKLPPADYCQYLSECAPQQRAAQEALQKEAVDYLGRARDAGSVSALWTFGAWYAEGEVLPKNDVEAYAHFHALDQINAASQQPQRFDRLLASIRSRLRPTDLDQAEVRSKELLSNPNCCVITP